jgi:gamma-glutamylputrescine oxidase
MLDAGGSWYEASVQRGPARPALQGRHEARVVIIGGGFAGLATALGLAERGVRDITLLEAGRIAHGASGRNGGFVFGGYSLGAAALARRIGPAPARALHGLTLDAVRLIRRRIDRHAIDCDAVDGGALLVNWFRDQALLEKIQREQQSLLGTHWPLIGRAALRADRVRSERYHGALFERDGFHFHPLAYALGLARLLDAAGVSLHENSAVTRIRRKGAGFEVQTAEAMISGEQAVCCGGGLLGEAGPGIVPELERAALPIATYVVATERLGDRLRELLPSRSAIYDTRFAFDYYRALPDTRLLWGGRISIRHRSPQAIAALLRTDIARVFPSLAGVRITHAWGGLMSYARHQMPQVGRLQSGERAGLWFATGFGGHGVAPTTAAGEVIAAAIAEGAPVPSGFAAYGLPRVWGAAGLAAAQASYWWAQGRDVLRERLEA